MSKRKTKREAIKELIAKHESNGDYNIVIGGGRYPLEDMTLGEVRDLQEALVDSGAPSGAVGKYQIIGKTLESIMRKNPKDFPPDRKFDASAQEEAADILLDRRGFKKFENGEVSSEKMATELAKEWASLPDPKTGKSYYDGDGINKSHHRVGDVLKLLEAYFPNEPRGNHGESKPKPDPVAGGGLQGQEPLQSGGSGPTDGQDPFVSSGTNSGSPERQGGQGLLRGTDAGYGPRYSLGQALRTSR